LSWVKHMVECATLLPSYRAKVTLVYPDLNTKTDGPNSKSDLMETDYSERIPVGHDKEDKHENTTKRNFRLRGRERNKNQILKGF